MGKSAAIDRGPIYKFKSEIYKYGLRRSDILSRNTRKKQNQSEQQSIVNLH